MINIYHEFLFAYDFLIFNFNFKETKIIQLLFIFEYYKDLSYIMRTRLIRGG